MTSKAESPVRSKSFLWIQMSREAPVERIMSGSRPWSSVWPAPRKLRWVRMTLRAVSVGVPELSRPMAKPLKRKKASLSRPSRVLLDPITGLRSGRSLSLRRTLKNSSRHAAPAAMRRLRHHCS